MNEGTVYRKYITPSSNEVVWTHKPYIPIDLRHTVPVARNKFVVEEDDNTAAPVVPEAWKIPVHPAVHSFSRHMEQKSFQPSSPSTRLV